MDWWASALGHLRGSFAIEYMLSPVYIAATVAIAYFVWRSRGRPTDFRRFLLPRELYVHPSTMVDLKVALFNLVVMATGAISALYFAPQVTLALMAQFAALTGAGPAGTTTVAGGIVAGAILFLTQDFCRYWNHYFHHERRFLWPFHAVHHSAEVMTPITFLRAHPLYTVLQMVVVSVLVGIAQAVVLFTLVGRIEPWVVYGGTLAFNAYVFFGAHLRHSHIWVSYGRTLEHILISPAQHQIHHSSDPRHFDRNYGEVFAIWDWMFGTLYIPDGPEQLQFGIADREGNRIPQPHPTLRAAMIGPFVEVWHELRKGTSFDPDMRGPAAGKAS